jgi:SnoaL-like domain
VSQENAHREQLSRFYNAFNARDLPGVLATLHPEIVFESRFARAGGTTYSGHAGVRGWFSDLADAWEYIVVDLGASRDVATDRTRPDHVAWQRSSKGPVALAAALRGRRDAVDPQRRRRIAFTSFSRISSERAINSSISSCSACR